MTSKENLYNTGKNMGRLALAGTALFVAAQHADKTNQGSEVSSQRLEVRGQVLTEEEITQLRNYDNFIAAASKVEPTATFTSTATSVAIPTEAPQKMEIMSVPQMTPEQSQLIEKYKEELPAILLKINADGQETEDLQTYYPIYRAAQDRYGVPWDLLWIIHEAESTASRNPAAFESNTHYGAMQRAVQFHTIEDRDRANIGLEYLRALPVRHFDDSAEIVLAAAEINEWAGEGRDYHKALLRYSARGPAEERFQKYLALESNINN